MPLFGSSSRSTSNNTSQNAAFSEVAGPASSFNVGGSLGGGSRSVTNFTLTDGGAIQGALGLGSQALTESMRQVELAGERSSAQLSAAIGAVSANARSDSENFGQQAIKWGSIVAVVLALAWAATKVKG